MYQYLIAIIGLDCHDHVYIPQKVVHPVSPTMQVHVYPASPNNIHGMDAVQLNNQALTLDRRGDYAGAEKLHKQAVAIKESSFGLDSLQTAISLNALGEVQLKLGKLDDAEANLRKAVSIRNAHQFSSFDAAVSRENLAQVLEARGNLAEAKAVRMTGAPNAISCGNYACQGQTFTVDKLLLCSKCKSVLYCSKSCQGADWKSRHKPLCKQAK
ncbi:hypothetical protein BD410DRAFT_780921 [Rickenella mellea]|uniref:MYND-type domain-containing protein n=1 Tax=Rickenella mellea TaxID=50990 RepID=A0A4Y7QMZ7_9AGAM|nr:hypothetical protein BD410DRAFT_780921 [Rickenella mellea]